MHGACSISTLRTKGAFSYSFNPGYPCCTNNRFERHPFHSSSAPPCCCCCCANSTYRAPTTPFYSYGLRQSTLIQWPSPCKKKLFLNDVEQNRCSYYYSRFPVRDVGRACSCEKDWSFGEKKTVSAKRGGRRYRCLVYEEDDSERESLRGVDEAEIVLSILTEQCFEGRNQRGNLSKDTKFSGKKKNVDSKSEYEVIVVGSREERGKGEEDRGEDERGSLLRREQRRIKAREENLLRQKENRAKEEKRERSLREDRRATEESRVRLLRREEDSRRRESEEFLRREEHRQRVRRDGSSCSSYYSLSSTGELNTNDESELNQEGGEEELLRKHRQELRRSNEIAYNRESEDRFERHEDNVDEQNLVSRKGKILVGSSAVDESEWRKKSEKKLTDTSVEEIESRQGSRKKQSTVSEVHESGKFSSSYKLHDDRRRKSSSEVFDEETVLQDRQASDVATVQPETRGKYKQFTEAQEMHTADFRASLSSQELYAGREEISSKTVDSTQKATERYDVSQGYIAREDENRRGSQKVAALKLEEASVRRTSNSQRLSEARMKNQENRTTYSSGYDVEQQQEQSSMVSVLEVSRRKSQQSTQVTESSNEETFISQRQSDVKMKKHEKTSNTAHSSSQEFVEKSSRMNAEDIRRLASSQRSEVTDMSMISYGHTHQTRVDQQTCASEGGVTSSLSELVDRGQVQVDSTSRLTAEEVSDTSLRTGASASHTHTLDRSPVLQHELYNATESEGTQQQLTEFSLHEDAIGSAEQLQKASSHYVGEFVEKVRHEISRSEIQKEEKTFQSKLVYEDEQHIRRNKSYSESRDALEKEEGSSHSDQGSGSKGPSVEMWDVTEPSNQVTPASKVSQDAGAEDNAVVKRTGRSLWNVIADIVHLRWGSRSDTRSVGSKSGRRSSPNQSTTTETWFSGREAEESNDKTVKGENRSMIQEPLSSDQQSIGQQREDSSLSGPNDQKHEQLDSQSSLTILEASSASSGETSGRNFEGAFASTSVAGSSLPALRLRRPIVEDISETGEANVSGSGSIVQIEQPVPTKSEISASDSKEVKLKQRMLKRANQVQRDKFDEWEEAYTLEAEQRKIDEMFMREALSEAKKAADNWEVPVGAVLVQQGKIIARGYNLVEELRDSTAHAEMICIREASNILRTWRLSETTLYVTLEPCPMCAGAILQARIDTVVWGAPNKLLGADGSWIRLFPDHDGQSALEPTNKPAAPVHPFHPNIVIRRGILAPECADAMKQFFQLRRKKKEKKEEPPTPPSCLPISNHPSKFFTKMHGAFNIMFCL